jgi:Tol biopolymer transport system component
MRIDSAGNVLIGQTTNPQGALLALSSRTKTSANTCKLAVDCGSTGVGINSVANATSSRTHIEFENGAIVGSISTSGSATAYNTSSDYRLKQDIKPLTDASNRLKLLKPSRFKFIRTPENTVDGFIAHEVQDIVPEAVTGEKDGTDETGNPIYQGIDQSKLVPLLTAALQEALAEIESLKARVTALEP